MAAELSHVAPLLEQRRYDEALSLLDHALRDDPADGRALSHSAYCLMRLGRHEEAVYRARRVGPGPDEGLALSVESASLVNLEKLDEALAVAEQALRVSGPALPSLLALCTVHTRLGHATEAIAYGRRALALDSTNQNALLVLASALALDGQQGAARRLLKKAVTLDPSDEVALGVGAALSQRGRHRGPAASGSRA